MKGNQSPTDLSWLRMCIHHCKMLCMDKMQTLEFLQNQFNVPKRETERGEIKGDSRTYYELQELRQEIRARNLLQTLKRNELVRHQQPPGFTITCTSNRNHQLPPSLKDLLTALPLPPLLDQQTAHQLPPLQAAPQLPPMDLQILHRLPPIDLQTTHHQLPPSIDLLTGHDYRLPPLDLLTGHDHQLPPMDLQIVHRLPPIDLQTTHHELLPLMDLLTGNDYQLPPVDLLTGHDHQLPPMDLQSGHQLPAMQRHKELTLRHQSDSHVKRGAS